MLYLMVQSSKSSPPLSLFVLSAFFFAAGRFSVCPAETEIYGIHGIAKFFVYLRLEKMNKTNYEYGRKVVS